MSTGCSSSIILLFNNLHCLQDDTRELIHKVNVIIPLTQSVLSCFLMLSGQHDQCLNEHFQSVAATFYYIILHLIVVIVSFSSDFFFICTVQFLYILLSVLVVIINKESVEESKISNSFEKRTSVCTYTIKGNNVSAQCISVCCSHACKLLNTQKYQFNVH